MKVRPSPRQRWLLLSDIHFKHHDLDRVVQAAQWIASLPQVQSGLVSRAVVCGDILTTRTSQPTHVLSACYRFFSRLVEAVPRVEILLGNHDLAYRRDYATTALDALGMSRLAPYVSLHSRVASHEWDGRRVLVMPFREEQEELVEAVRRLDPAAAAETVGFGHLAIHRAILQRHVIKPTTGPEDVRRPITYRGLTGAGHFASLARTYTGHFHSHQTILQQQLSPQQQQHLAEAAAEAAGAGAGGDDGTITITSAAASTAARLRGSVTYIGSPLQLGWADLRDTDRGVVLLDPVTLQHELVVNPHAVGYTMADLQAVLDRESDPATIADKHVMLTGDLTGHRYVTARDLLLDLGARSVRSWSPMAPTLKPEYQSLGMTVLPIDAEGGGLDGLQAEASYEPANSYHVDDNGLIVEIGNDLTGWDGGGPDDIAAAAAGEEGGATEPGELEEEDDAPEVPQIDFTEIVRDYVGILDLEPGLDARRELITLVGQRLIRASGHVADDTTPEDYKAVSYKQILDPAAHGPGSGALSETATAATARHVFVAEPVTITVTNFLGIQGSLTIDFARHFRHGLTFVVGNNGSGKSTLVEAVVWAQFGRCLRSGLGVNDVINDRAGKDCSVRLQFRNGFTITRYRKHQRNQNRVIVELDGVEQTQFEKPGKGTTQDAIDELLGVDYATFVRTVVLGHESAASFLSSGPVQRRELIEALLGLEQLETYAGISKLMMQQVDMDAAEVECQTDALSHTMAHVEGRAVDLKKRSVRLGQEVDAAENALARTQADRLKEAAEIEKGREKAREAEKTPDELAKDTASKLDNVDAQLAAAQQEVDRLNGLAEPARLRVAVEREQVLIEERTTMAKRQLKNVRRMLDKMVQQQQQQESARAAAAAASGSGDEQQRARMIKTGSTMAKKVHNWLQAISAAAEGDLKGVYVENEQRMDTVVGALETLRRDLKEMTPAAVDPAASAASEAGADYNAAFDDLRQHMASTEAEIESLMGQQEAVYGRVGKEHAVADDQVRDAVARIDAAQARDLPGLLSSAISRLSTLSSRRVKLQRVLEQGAELDRERELRRQAEAERERLEDDKAERRWAVLLENLRAAATSRKQEVATYTALLETEEQRLADMKAERRGLQDRMGVIRADREIFAFWTTAFSRRQVRPTSMTFRGYVMEQSLHELNSLFAHILTVLYDDTRHARGMTTGMLKSLFTPADGEGGEGGEGGSGSGEPEPAKMIDKSIKIASSLSYAKRSGGERKRIDLALFFALLELGRARSAHRAGYVLVDEVFDSLDRAGQAGVARWCGWMAERSGGRKGRVLIITHSEHLVNIGRGEESLGGAGGDGIRMGLVRARMGSDGTEYEWDVQ